MVYILCEYTGQSYINYGKHILKCHIGQKEENGAIDIHYTILRQFLAKEYNANNQRYHLSRKKRKFLLTIGI